MCSARRQGQVLITASVCFVHNGQLVDASDGVGIERGVAAFLHDLQARYGVVAVSGFLSRSSKRLAEVGCQELTAEDGHTLDVRPIGIIPELGPEQSLLRKSLRYVAGSISGMKLTRSYDFFYIALPGNVGLIVALWCLMLRRRFAILVAGEWAAYSGPYRAVFRLVIKRALFVIAASSSHTSDLKILNSNVEQLSPMTAYKLGAANVKANSIVNNPPRLLFVGYVTRAKGIYDLLLALKLLHEASIQATLEIVGAGTDDDMRDVERSIEEHSLSGYARIHGYVSDVRQLKRLYEAADIFVFPSHTEGFPRVLFEAMAAGLPVVATNLPSYRGTMVNGENFVAVKPQSPGELAEAIRAVVCDDKLRQRIGRGGLETICGVLSSTKNESHADQFSRLFSVGV